MRTLEPMLSPAPLSWEPLAAPAPRRWLRWFIPLFLVVALGVAAFWPVPYFILAPGTARQVDDLIHVPSDKAFRPRGRVLLATVSLIGDVRFLDLVRDRFDDDMQSIPRRVLLGNQTRDQMRQQQLQEMDNSKEVAIVAALRRLGHQVAEHGEGALVEQLVELQDAGGRRAPANPAAADHLRAGDVIVAVDGRPTPLLQDVQAAIRAHRPGDVIRLEVAGTDGSRRREEVPLVRRPGSDLPLLGVTLHTKGQRFDLPFPVTVDSLGIGGPSAGLAYALGVIDLLTPGELTGGKRVAVTGTISSDGTVGDVGGVTEKTAAVRAARADAFLVPPGEYDEARARAGSKLQVFRVTTLEEAITALGRLGGDISALGPAPAPARG